MKYGWIIVAAACAGAGQAGAQERIDLRRIASCQIAAENMRDRVRPEAEDYARYDGDARYWAGQVARFVPEAGQREGLLAEGRGVLNQALGQQDYMAGMVMVSQVLQQCNADRSAIEGAAPHG